MAGTFDPLLDGFSVETFLRPPRFYRTVEIDARVPLDEQALCPGDRTPLATACSFFNSTASVRVRVGFCPLCGYLGYRDRPTQEWIQKYYFDTWDGAEKISVARAVERYRKLGASTFLDSVVSALRLDKDRPVLEIGCGYGRMLGGLRARGFTRLWGVEHSPHRAEVARRVFGAQVLDAAPFEDEKTQEELRRQGPFGFIFSNHVLEHTYNPGEIVARAASLQKAGDHLMLSLPNADKEPIGTALFYLPHLHGFTKDTLRGLFSSHGYKIVLDDSRGDALALVGQKMSSSPLSPPPLEGRGEKVGEIKERFARCLGIGKSHPSTRRILWWFRKLEYGGQVSALPGPFTWPQWLFMSKYAYARKYKDLLVRELGEDDYRRHPLHTAGMIGATVAGLSKRHTTPDESILEIQFAGDITLLSK